MTTKPNTRTARCVPSVSSSATAFSKWNQRTDRCGMPQICRLPTVLIHKWQHTFDLSVARVTGDNLAGPWTFDRAGTVNETDAAIAVGACVACYDVWAARRVPVSYVIRGQRWKIQKHHTEQSVSHEDVRRFCLLIDKIELRRGDVVAHKRRVHLLFINCIATPLCEAPNSRNRSSTD